MRSITLFKDNGSYLTKMHPFTKLVYILFAIVTPLVIGNLWVMGGFVVLSFIILASGRVFRRSLPLIAFSFTLILIIFIVQSLFYHGNENVLLALGPIHIYKEGTLYATRIGLNILNMLVSFAIFVLTTRPQELVDEMEKHGFSEKIGYIINSVFMIIPQMMSTMDTIMDAQRSRGMETEGSLLTRAKAFVPLISPVVMSSLVNTRERAIALEVRGFGGKKKKTWLYDRQKHKGDSAITVILLALMVAAIVWRVVA